MAIAITNLRGVREAGRLVAGPTFYQLHLLFDKHAEEQNELIDLLAERVQSLGGIAVGDPRHAAELTTIPRPPDGAEEVAVMIAAVVIAVGVMFVASGPLSRFVHQHPSVKMLALAFLLLIGVTLVADGFGFHVPKGYIYAAMAFSVGVELLNMIQRNRRAKATATPE